MCKIIKNALNTSRNLNILEITIFKFYLVSFVLILSILFPIILSSSIYFYIILFVVLDLLSIVFLVKKEWNFLKKIFTEKWYRAFKNYWVLDFALFKLTLASFWLLLAKVFPVFLEVHIWIYLTIVGFWIWYFLAKNFWNIVNKK